MPSENSVPRELPTLALTLEELKQPAPAQTATLLDLAARLWKRKPWKTLDETEIFAVRNPGDNELYFVSVLGGAGEQAGVVVYRGADAYFGLLDFTERASQMPALPDISPEAFGEAGAAEMMEMLAAQISQMNFNPMELLQIPQLQLMFESRDELADIDGEWIARHQYKASGRGYPTFRSVVPGYLPWWIAADEVDVLIVALEQLEELLARPNFSSDLLQVNETVDESSDETLSHELFARVAAKNQSGEMSWRDERIEVEPGELFRIEIEPDAELMERVQSLKTGKDVMEMELIEMPTPVGGYEERPCFPSLILTGQNQMVTGMQTILCGPGPRRTPLLLDAILTLLSERETRPKTIQFANPYLGILSFVEQTLGIQIEEVEELPTLDPAIESLMEQMTADGFGEDLDDEDFDDDDPEMMPRLH